MKPPERDRRHRRRGPPTSIAVAAQASTRRGIRRVQRPVIPLLARYSQIAWVMATMWTSLNEPVSGLRGGRSCRARAGADWPGRPTPSCCFTNRATSVAAAGATPAGNSVSAGRTLREKSGCGMGPPPETAAVRRGCSAAGARPPGPAPIPRRSRPRSGHDPERRRHRSAARHHRGGLLRPRRRADDDVDPHGAWRPLVGDQRDRLASAADRDRHRQAFVLEQRLSRRLREAVEIVARGR